MDKASALELIKGLETARAKWIARLARLAGLARLARLAGLFDKWVTSQADRPAGITKEYIKRG